ncbi:glycosyltransferase family 2 protein [Aeromonas hydrophila]
MLIRNLDVIIPVYRGLDETKECIYSLLSNMPQWAQLIVINDSSPEPELTNWLRQEAVQLGFELYENEFNKGFVGTVNFGMSLNKDRDVLLLNSDVEVSNLDWLNRMRKAAYSHERVASLTPFSNNATICSFPHFVRIMSCIVVWM